MSSVGFVLTPITCSNETNFPFMMRMITTLCPNGFAVDVVTSSRCRLVYKGKCCWTAYYRSTTPNNINTKAGFKGAIEIFNSYIPHGSKIVAYGRYGSADFGIFITYANINCICPSDFEQLQTPFPILEQRMNESKILFVNEHQNDVDDILFDDDAENRWLEMTELIYQSGNLGLADNLVIQPEIVIFDKEMFDYVGFVANRKDVEMMIVSQNGQFQIWCRAPFALNGTGLFSEVCDVDVELLQSEQSNSDLFVRSETLKDNIRSFGAIKDVCHERVEWEAKVQKCQKEFDEISAEIKKKTTQFEIDRVRDFKPTVIKYLDWKIRWLTSSN